MSFLLSIPADSVMPLRWAADIVFGEMLGLRAEIAQGAQRVIVIETEGRRIVMPSLFPDLQADRSLWMKQLPLLPLDQWNAAVLLPDADLEDPLPVLFGRPKIEIASQEIRCGIDILGTVFFMLSRFEEIVSPERDAHNRFPATASLAWKAGFLYHPIVDEYVDVLWTMMKRLWPGLTRRRRQGQVKVSCDVDQPFDRIGSNPFTLLRVLRHELLVKPRPAIAARRTANFLATPFGSLRFDPFHTFDWYMDLCERHDRRAAFYFIADHSAGAIDGTYDIDEPRILALMQRIRERGHEIGMHGSYNSYDDRDQIKKERKRLAAACENAGIGSSINGNRQHYLRWDASQTPEYLDEAGFGYDTTGAFADRPGFRYGTSHPFPMWSWQRMAPLALQQVPLVLMECSVIAERYLGLGHTPDALELMLGLKDAAMRHGGDFTMLWHNSHFLTGADRAFFERLLQ